MQAFSGSLPPCPADKKLGPIFVLGDPFCLRIGQHANGASMVYGSTVKTGPQGDQYWSGQDEDLGILTLCCISALHMNNSIMLGALQKINEELNRSDQEPSLDSMRNAVDAALDFLKYPS